MPWFNVDDGFADHPKVLKLQSEDGWQSALSLWTLAGSWSSKHLTDGAISKVVVARLGCTQKDAELLVECGLWERSPDGYIFHDWLSRNPSRAQVEAKRERTRDRVTKHRRNAVTDGVTQHVTTVVTNAAGNGVSNTTPILSSPLQSNPRERAESAQARESSPPATWSEPGESVGWTAQAQRTAFIAAFEASQRTTPGMGGKAVGSFHADVLRTAELQGVEPGKLFRDTLARWLGAGLDETARRAPYACFQAAWGGLTSKGPSGPPAGSQAPQTASAARAAATEAMARGDMASVTALITRARELEDAEERRRGRR